MTDPTATSAYAPRAVVLGGGFGGLTTSFRRERDDASSDDAQTDL